MGWGGVGAGISDCMELAFVGGDGVIGWGVLNSSWI